MKFYYLIHFQFLGFRYHGWQKQTKYKTIQGTVEESVTKILGDQYKTIGASRTDSMVSAMHSCFELITETQLDPVHFSRVLDKLLPPDIRILKCESVDRKFRMITSAKHKEYLYFFSCGEKGHPFSAPFITHMNEELNIEMMKEAAAKFIGVHNFKNYCYRPSEGQDFEREIFLSEICVNNVLSANFFPEHTYIFRVQAESFMRHQVRLMMGILFRIGMDQFNITELITSLEKPTDNFPSMIAPASGLILNQLTLDAK
ncbi:MAG: tRNA pseudouridine(38-40) synthase TruA [Bacteriovorax sp.]|jgi:tRNA pseudouridine38-40 synthase